MCVIFASMRNENVVTKGDARVKPSLLAPLAYATLMRDTLLDNEPEMAFTWKLRVFFFQTIYY